MIDISEIEENYSRMSDLQLINLSKEDGKELTPPALQALKKEFVKRSLPVDIFDSISEDKLIQQTQNIQEIKESASTEFTNSIWNYALIEKKQGKPDREILKGIMEKGLDEEHSLLIIKSLENRARELADSHDTEMLTGGLACIAGLIITIWTYTAAQNGGYYVVAWGAIIFGAIRFFKGMSNKDMYKSILKNISSEQKILPAEKNG